MNDARNRRILLIDDNPAIHEDFRKILKAEDPVADAVDQQARILFGGSEIEPSNVVFNLESAFQGEEGLSKVRQSMAAGQPHAMAFVDMRMPPGWDGLETIRRIWEVHSELEMVICTAFSDHSWQDIQRVLGTSDKLLILKKPFDKVEVQQLAVALTEKWNLRRLARLHSDGLADLVRTRTSDLARCYEAKNELMARASQESMRLMERLVETAESFGGTTSNEQQRKSTSDLQDLSKRLLSHLGDVITFHTIEAGKLQIESREYNLRALCQSAVEGCSVRARARGLRVTLTVEDTLPAQVYGCAEQVLHVLALLIDEAIERGVAGGGDITVSVKRAVRVNTLEFEITGTVLSANQIVTLNFTQEARECSTASDQLSLGFAVAGKLVETLGGSIERQSKAGQASISRFTLPLETQPKRLGSDQRDPRAYPGR